MVIIMKKFVLLLLTVSAGAFANDIIDALKTQHTTAYEETLAACEQWAADDGVAEEERQAYIEQCIIDEIGYLVESAQ